MSTCSVGPAEPLCRAQTRRPGDAGAVAADSVPLHHADMPSTAVSSGRKQLVFGPSSEQLSAQIRSEEDRRIHRESYG